MVTAQFGDDVGQGRAVGQQQAVPPAFPRRVGRHQRLQRISSEPGLLASRHDAACARACGIHADGAFVDRDQGSGIALADRKARAQGLQPALRGIDDEGARRIFAGIDQPD
ncbi:hypothetical protein G6F62_014401 [Rhizopus arrhizus]|nr:hypothetical protein G6F62_014401 [Rhizopus arrhizus]